MNDNHENPERETKPWREPWPGALADLKAYIEKSPNSAAVLAEFMARFPKVTRDQAIQMLWEQGILPRV